MKKKLFAAGMSLLMATVLMVGTSLAWFTVSQAPEVTNIDVEMSSVQNIEIAIGKNEPEEVKTGQAGYLNYWGNSVNYKTDGIKLGQMATYENSSVKTVTYDDTGRADKLDTVTKTTAGTDVGTDPVAVTTGATPTTYIAQAKAADGTTKDYVCAVEYNLWLRSNSVETVTVTVAPTDNNFTDGMVLYVDGTKITKSQLTTTISLTKNQAKNVKIVVLVDGSDKYAKDVTGTNSFKGKITFSGATSNSSSG